MSTMTAVYSGEERQKSHQSTKASDPLLDDCNNKSEISVASSSKDANTVVLAAEVEQGQHHQKHQQPRESGMMMGRKRRVRVQSPTPIQIEEISVPPPAYNNGCEAEDEDEARSSSASNPATPISPRSIALGVSAAFNIVRKVSQRVSTGKKQGKKKRGCLALKLISWRLFFPLMFPRSALFVVLRGKNSLPRSVSTNLMGECLHMQGIKRGPPSSSLLSAGGGDSNTSHALSKLFFYSYLSGWSPCIWHVVPGGHTHAGITSLGAGGRHTHVVVPAELTKHGKLVCCHVCVCARYCAAGC